MGKTWTTRKTQFLLLNLVPLYFLIAGLSIQSPAGILRGLATIVKEPDFLITDYMAIGGIGAAFVNAGLLTFLCIAIIYVAGMEMDGHTITSCFLMFGFSLFGKNILNIWSILAGVWLYARYHQCPVAKYLYVGFYGTCLSPIITQVLQIVRLPLIPRFLLSILVGVAIGFTLPPLSGHLSHAHRGYSLYNVGFASGIIATVVVSVFKSFGIQTESRLIWSTGHTPLMLFLLVLFFLGMFLLSLGICRRPWRGYLSILRSPGVGGTDYTKSDGFSPTLLNMAVNGLFSTLFVVAVGGELNGPTIGGIFTVAGFGPTGKHLRNIFPVMAGVWLAGQMKYWNIADPSPLLSLLFSTTLAPIAGEFGVPAGILAGFLHSSAALNVGIIYGGMNLYNNGFAGGLIAVFMVPVILSIRDRRVRAEEEGGIE